MLFLFGARTTGEAQGLFDSRTAPVSIIPVSDVWRSFPLVSTYGSRIEPPGGASLVSNRCSKRSGSPGFPVNSGEKMLVQLLLGAATETLFHHLVDSVWEKKIVSRKVPWNRVSGNAVLSSGKWR